MREFKGAAVAEVEEGLEIALVCSENGAHVEVTPSKEGLLLARSVRAVSSSAFKIERLKSGVFTLRSRATGALVGLAETPVGLALAAGAATPERPERPLGFALQEGRLLVRGAQGTLYLSSDPRVGVGRLVLVGGVLASRLAGLAPVHLVPVPLPRELPVAIPVTTGLAGPAAATGLLPPVPHLPKVDAPGIPAFPLPELPPVELPPLDLFPKEKVVGKHPEYVIALVRDRSGRTRSGVGVRLVDADRLIDQTATNESGVALLRWPADIEPRGDDLATLEVETSAGSANVVFRAKEDEGHVVVEATVDALPTEGGPGDDPFARLPLHHPTPVSDELVRWASPLATGLAGEDGARARFATRRWEFVARVPVARLAPDGTRYLAIVRQDWTHVGDSLGELLDGRAMVPGESTREHGTARPAARVADAPAAASDWDGLSGAWTPSLAHEASVTREASERAHAAPLTDGLPLPAPRHEAADLLVLRQPPLPGVVTNVFAWRVRSRFAVRSRIEEVLHVVAQPLPRAEGRDAFAPEDVVDLMDLLAPALRADVVAAALPRLQRAVETRRAASRRIRRVRVETAHEARGAAATLTLRLRDASLDVPLGSGTRSATGILALDAPRIDLTSATFDLVLDPSSLRVSEPAATEDDDLRRLAASVQARAVEDAEAAARVRLDRLRLQVEDEDGVVETLDLPAPAALALGRGRRTASATLPLPFPAVPSAADDPLVRHVREEEARCLGVLFARAREDPHLRPRVQRVLGLAPDAPLWRARVLGVEGGQLLLAEPARRDDPHAAALAAHEGDATVVHAPTRVAFSDLVVGEDHAGLLDAITRGEGKDLLAGLLPGLPSNLAGLLAALPELPQANLPDLGALAQGLRAGQLPQLPTQLPAGLPGLPTTLSKVPLPVAAPKLPELSKGVAAPKLPVALPALPKKPGGLGLLRKGGPL